jgi:hypothetical protein
MDDNAEPSPGVLGALRVARDGVPFDEVGAIGFLAARGCPESAAARSSSLGAEECPWTEGRSVALIKSSGGARLPSWLLSSVGVAVRLGSAVESAENLATEPFTWTRETPWTSGMMKPRISAIVGATSTTLGRCAGSEATETSVTAPSCTGFPPIRKGT